MSEAVVGRSATVKTKHRGLDIATDAVGDLMGFKRRPERSEKMEETVDGRDEMTMPSLPLLPYGEIGQ